METKKKTGSLVLPTDHAAICRFIWETAEMNDGFTFTYLGGTLLGKAIPMIQLGDESADSAFLYVGAHHAMEHITASVLLAFASDYLNSANHDGVLIYVIPMLNCDGVDIEIHGVPDDNPLRDRLLRMNGNDDFSKWQANVRGVDLNHNYDAGFKEYKRVERSLGILGGAPTRFSGEYPESEPEVGALCNFLRFNDRIKGCLTLHTQGEEIFCGDTEACPSSGIIGKKAAEAAGYRLSEPEGPALFGGMTDWVTSKLGRPSLTVECGLGENPLPSSSFPSLYSRLRRLLFTFPSMFELT